MTTLILAVLVAAVGGAPAPDGWRCRNAVEVQCHDGDCAALDRDETTPLDVAFTTTGSFIVCAYTGCWEGDGEVLATEPFLVIEGEDAPWSDPSNPDNVRDVLIAFDRGDGIASVKAGVFVVPLACEALAPIE